MALPKNDGFTTASDQHLHDYNVNWKDNNSSEWTVLDATDDVYPSTPGYLAYGFCHWEGDTFSNDQYSRAMVSNIESLGFSVGVAVRVASGSTGTGYLFYASLNSDNGHVLMKVVSGVSTQIGSREEVSTQIYDILSLEVSGETLYPKRNTLLWTLGSKTDSSIGSGYAGLSANGSASTDRLDDFEGGDLEGCFTQTVTSMIVNTYTITVTAMQEL